MSSKRMLHRVVGLVALLLAAAPFGHGQTAAQKQRAEKLHAEAVALQAEQKHGPAAAKMKEAAELLPKDEGYRRYAAELEEQATREPLTQHALKAPAEEEQTPERLAKYLTKSAKSDQEKAWVIFRWIADRVIYDAAGAASGRLGDNSPAGVLKSRKAVCEGYSQLFERLCKEAKLEAVQVTGYTKPTGYVPGTSPIRSDHAWNAVRLDGEWHLVDPTFGAGFAVGTTATKQLEEYYFLTPPDQLIFTHWPDEAKWQLLKPAVAAEEFRAWPKVEFPLFQYGFSGAEVRAKLKENPPRGLVQTFPPPGAKVVVKAPLEQGLKQGATYKFRIEAPTFLQLAVVNNDKWQYLPRKGNVFEGEVPARKGELVLCGKSPGKKNFGDILRYVVE